MSGSQSFRKGEFDKLACNKMRMVQSIAQNCDVDSVFTDVDNVFFKNPCEYHFGRLISTNRTIHLMMERLVPIDVYMVIQEM